MAIFKTEILAIPGFQAVHLLHPIENCYSSPSPLMGEGVRG
ncbi:hypothetical protein MC7420_3966 [Coleofasciculus chthonoplastes PCC 7420]|uniref:Uncharacterized protein n=1 Tax=Coleofasciculus chthonoplastes PCC 7420 TaxID=118168 RepID=B4VUR4_9CYAN|nr:hypothetical protein MC7420_3966 [Coleofasciculus chthonoplastes PCC 7420]